MLLAVVVAVAPILEEWLFRRLLLGWLRKRLSVERALVIQAVLFGVLHLDGGTAGGVFAALLLGVILGAMYVHTGALWMCAVTHGSVNAFVVIIGVRWASDAGPISSGMNPWLPFAGSVFLYVVLAPLAWFAWRLVQSAEGQPRVPPSRNATGRSSS